MKLILVLGLLCNVSLIILAKKPNVLIIVADDYGWNDIGYHGSEIKTPNLDSLARVGVKLENYYVQPVCTPTRSQLMSGRYQIHTGLQHEVIHPLMPNGLPLKLPTLANALKNEGYATHIVGKWHLGYYKKEFLPTNRGFDTFYGYLNGAEDYYSHRRDQNYVYEKTTRVATGLDFRDNLSPVLDQNGTYSAGLFAERAQSLVKQHVLNNTDQVRMVAALDEAIGNVTSAFKENGLWDNTLLIFTTDNGGQVFAGGNNWPLKGGKTTLWEGGVRGVGFVSGGLMNDVSGSVRNELMHVSDWFPTIMAAIGAKPTDIKLDGHSQWEAIRKGDKAARTELLHNIDPKQTLYGKPMFNDTFLTNVRAAIRVGDWKLLTGDPGVLENKHFPVPTSDENEANRIDLVPETENKNKNVWLYNVKQDPYEYNDLSNSNPMVVRKLLDRLAYYNSTAVPCVYPDKDPRGDPRYLGDVWGPWL